MTTYGKSRIRKPDEPNWNGTYSAVADKFLDVRSQSGNELNCLCPFHDDSTPSLRFNVETGLWKCWGCQIAGTAEMLVNKFDGAFDLTALKLESVKKRLEDLSRAQAHAGSYAGVHAGAHSLSSSIGEGILKRYNFPTDYWTKRGFTRETITAFELGYDPTDKMGSVPLRNEDGDLLGVMTRPVDWVKGDDREKFRYPYKFPRERNLYGSHLVASMDDDFVVLVEGPLDAVKVWQAGYPALAVYGSSLSAKQVQLIYRLGVRRACLFFDYDRAGQDATWGHRLPAAPGKKGKWVHGARRLLNGIDLTLANYAGHPWKSDPGGMSDPDIRQCIGTATRVSLQKLSR